jgi:pyruvate carboxylase
MVVTDMRTEADEAYVIGKRGQYTPVGAYLAADEIVKIAVEHGAQMIHPGMQPLSRSTSVALLILLARIRFPVGKRRLRS